jgi:hypothetical protein
VKSGHLPTCRSIICVMGLLTDIQQDVISQTVPLSATLRKCRLLAARLASEPLQQWIVHESDGYPDASQLPDYRVFGCRVVGHFTGAFGSGLRNAEIPPMCIPEAIRDRATECRIDISVAEIESLLGTDLSEGLKSPLPGNWVVALGTKVYRDMNCLSAWRSVPVTGMAGILNTVRNRVLDFAVEVERKNPKAGEASLGAPTIPPQEVTHIFNTTVIGGAANVTGHASGSTITANSSVVGNISELRRVLAAGGIDSKQLDELEKAIRQDQTSSNPKEVGPKVSAWMGQTLANAAAGAIKGGATTAAVLVAKAIAAYYNLPHP